MLGVGGGSLSVPFFSYFNTPMKKAIATTSVLTFIIAIIGTTAFMLLGKSSLKQEYFFGYIYASRKETT